MNEITIEALSFCYDTTPALQQIDLTIRRGEFFTLLGPSGCGKTTLLRLLGGFLTPQSGRILIEGQDITHVPPEKRRIGTVFQSYALFPHLTCAENVAYGLRVLRTPRAERENAVREYLRLVGLEAFADRKIGALSGGQQQRVALARSLIVHPTVLLLDEPMSNLDAALREEMCEELQRLQRELGITTVFVTHNQEEAFSLSDRIAIMESGRVVQLDTPERLYADPQSDFVATFLGKVNLVGAGECPFGIETSRYLRPEQLFLSRKPHPHTRPVTIVRATFGGNLWQYRCQDGEREWLVSDFWRHGDALRAGEAVFLGCRSQEEQDG